MTDTLQEISDLSGRKKIVTSIRDSIVGTIHRRRYQEGRQAHKGSSFSVHI